MSTVLWPGLCTTTVLPESFQPWPPLLSDWLETTAGMAIVGVVVWWIWSPGSKLQRLLVVIAANLVVTVGIKSLLKGTFGRTWPESWLGENPSLIANGVYGFHLFHFGRAYASFPSGHAAATFAVVSILWLSRPRFRWLYALVAAGMCLALVGLNYHFVSDVLAGAVLGSLTASAPRDVVSHRRRAAPLPEYPLAVRQDFQPDRSSGSGHVYPWSAWRTAHWSHAPAQ